MKEIISFMSTENQFILYKQCLFTKVKDRHCLKERATLFKLGDSHSFFSYHTYMISILIELYVKVNHDCTQVYGLKCTILFYDSIFNRHCCLMKFPLFSSTQQGNKLDLCVYMHRTILLEIPIMNKCRKLNKN